MFGIILSAYITFLLLNFTFANDIIVSQRNGSNDNITCGNTTSPCRTIHYAVMNVSQNNDVILIDGGNEQQFTYNENSITINTTNLTLKKWSESKYKPKIIYIQPGNVFVTCVNNTKLDIMSLIISSENSSLLLMLGTAFIRAQDSILISKKFALKSQDYMLVGSVTVCIYSSYVYGQIFLNAVTFLSKNSNFELNSDAYVVTTIVRVLHVYLYNCTFSHGGFAPYVSASQHKNRIIDCHFIDCIFMLESFENVFIRGTTFEQINSENIIIEPLFLIDNCKNVFLEDCTFSNSINGACSITNSKIIMKRNKFLNNTSIWTDGGVIYSENSIVVIDDCLFKNNSASVGASIIQDTSTNDECSFNLLNIVIYEDQPVPLGSIISSVTNNAHIENVSIIVTHPMLVKTAVITFVILDGTLNITSPFLLTCPPNHNLIPHHIGPAPYHRIFSTYCTPCNVGTYSLDNGKQYANVSGLYEYYIKCKPCPSGGLCNGTITSRDNYWGYLRSNNTLEFIQCPPYYCCSKYTSKCTTYNTCNEYRRGAICGVCDDGYSENILSTRCIMNSHCNRLGMRLFWIIYVIFCICFVVLLMNKDVLVKYCTSTSDTNIVHDDDLKENLLIDANTENISYRVKNHVATEESKQSSTISGLIKIIFQFYQIESLLRVNASAKNQLRFASKFVTDMLSSIFSITINTESGGMVICPIIGLNMIGKEFIKASLPLTCLLIAIILILCNQIYKYFKSNREEEDPLLEEYVYEGNNEITPPERIPLQLKLKCFIVQIMLLGYLSFSIFLFKSINCVAIDDNYKLYIQGNIQCYNWWQIVILFIIILWSGPFFISLYASSSLLKSYRITPNQFLITLFFPPATIVYMIRCRNTIRRPLNRSDAMIANQFLLVLYEPFRLDENGEVIKWECVLIFRRLSIILANIFIIHPIGKLYFIFTLLLVNLSHHMSVKAYKGNMLNSLETISLFLLCLLCSINMFWAGCYMLEFKSIPQFDIIGETFLLFEMLVLMMPMIMMVLYLLGTICNKCVRYFRISG